MRLRGRRLAALLVAAFVVTASTCKEVTVKVIDSQSESQLVYPGGQVAWGDSLAPYGFLSGKRTYIVGAPAAMDDILAWYDRQLRQRGWTRLPAASDVTASWERGYERFSLDDRLPKPQAAELRDGAQPTYYVVSYSLSCGADPSASAGVKPVC